MENTTANLRTSTDRVLKTDSQRGRSLSQERKQFIEEEYDVYCIFNIDYSCSFFVMK